jgi:hypothetical protein
LDCGSIICKGSDEFGLVIKYKVWGFTFYWGNRDIEKLGERSKFDRLQFTKIQPRYAEQRKKRIDSRDYYEAKEQKVRQGKKKNPADMTYPERHQETLKVISKMEFSENFVHLMTTPVAKLALERGDISQDDVTGEILTEEIYEREKAKNLRLGVPNAGLLGFKKAEEGEGYEAINIPGSELRQVASSVGQKLQLEDGR